MEIWKEIEGYPRFEVSNLGRIRRDYLYVIDPIKENKYHYARLTNSGISKNKAIHILVLEAFSTRPSGTWEVNHKDFQKNNNHLHNLEWVTRKQNSQHSLSGERVEIIRAKQRLSHNKNGDHPNYTLSDGDVLAIKKRRFNKEPLESIAKEFKVSEAVVSMLSYGKRRASIGPEYTLVPKVRGRKMKRIFVWVKGVKVYCS